MHTLRHNTIYPKRQSRVNLYALFDIHFGEWSCNLPLLKRHIREIAADDNGYVVLNGDMVGAINPKDPRYDASVQNPKARTMQNLAQRQSGRFVELLKPISHKIIAMGTGNHEDASRKYGGHDPYETIAKGIARHSGRNVADFTIGVGGIIVWHFSRGKKNRDGWAMKIRMHHGYGGSGLLPGGGALFLGREIDRHSDCHLLLFGHRHVKAAVEKVGLSVDNITSMDISRIRCKAFLVPSYQNTHVGVDNERDELGLPVNTWAEHKGMFDQPQGMLRVVIHPNSQRLWGMF